MWILLAGVLMCYLLGFVLYCCYNSSQQARRHRRGGDADNPSGSPSSAPMMRRAIVATTSAGDPSSAEEDDGEDVGGGGRRRTGGGCTNLLNRSPHRRSSSNHPHHHQRRLSPSSTPSSLAALIPLTSCLYDEISDRNCDLPHNQPSPQPTLLTAHREQQLRQIKLEINALSCRLGIGQIYRDPQHESRHVAVGPTMRTRHIFVQPVVGRRYDCRQGERGGRGGHELNSRGGLRDTMTMMVGEEDGGNNNNNVVGSGGGSYWDEDEVLESSDRSLESSSLEMSFLSSSSTLPSSVVSVETASGANPPPPSPLHATGDHNLRRPRHHPQRQHFIYSERERRLQLIRMEIEDLTLQLSSLSGVDQTGASENNHAGGCSITSSELEGLVYDPSDSDVDETEALMNSYSISMSTHDLPSYDESVILEMNESPPPSYAQCAHLYSPPPANHFLP